MQIQKPILKKKTSNKKYFFTCAGLKDGSIIAETYFLNTREQSYNQFYQIHGIYPSFLDGPFYRKLEKNKKEISRQDVKLSGKVVNATYKDQPIKAMILASPQNYALLIGKINNKNNIVHISEIKIDNE